MGQGACTCGAAGEARARQEAAQLGQRVAPGPAGLGSGMAAHMQHGGQGGEAAPVAPGPEGPGSGTAGVAVQHGEGQGGLSPVDGDGMAAAGQGSSVGPAKDFSKFDEKFAYVLREEKFPRNLPMRFEICLCFKFLLPGACTLAAQGSVF